MNRKLSILTVFGITALSSIATADIKSYHGNSCQCSTFNGGLPCDGDEVSYSATGPGPQDDLLDLALSCPLIRDRINSASGITAVYVEMTHGSSHSTTVIAFTQNEDAAGTTVDTDSGNASGSGFKQVGPLQPTTSNGNEGSYGVTVLGLDSAGDRVHHIYVDEDNGTDD